MPVSGRCGSYPQTMAKIGRNDPCKCGSGRKYKKCCGTGRSSLALAPNTQPATPEMQLVIETSTGLAVRNISAAMPRRLLEPQGKEAENVTHDAAATWGLADFVFEPSIRRRSSGIRELGDGIILLGDLGIVLQVKSREAPTGNPGRERMWIEKRCRKALSQGSGTIRELCRVPAPLTNLRGRSISLDGNRCRWLVAVIVDHDEPPSDVKLSPGKNALILLRRDWDFLFEQLKSTHGVGRYLERVSGEPVDLGDEPIRYYQLAGADADAERREFAPEYVLPGMKRINEPLLPMAPAGTTDQDEHRLFRTILEDIASIRLSAMPEELRIRSLAELDGLPTEQRAEAGRFLLEALRQAAQANPPGVLWRHRRILGEGATQLALSVCSRSSKELEMAFGTWVELRHHEFTERIGSDQSVTVGVLLTPQQDGKKQWDTTMTVAEGRLTLTDEQLAAYVEVWKTEQDVAAA
jgi:hypothetical protein